MTLACDKEFRTIDILIESNSKSRGVDAFCLSWIKHERQLRRISAFLIYQSSKLNHSDQSSLRNALLNKKKMSHEKFRGCVWRLTQTSIKELIGERYNTLNQSLNRSFKNRNKIFHGQQTGDSLTRTQLLSRSKDIREWCTSLAISCNDRFGYDGFKGTTSLFKSKNPELTTIIDKALERSENWQNFIQKI